MKLLFRKSYGRSVFAALPALLTMLFAVACQDDESQKWVDLRYKAEDAYILEGDRTQSDPIAGEIDPIRGESMDCTTIGVRLLPLKEHPVKFSMSKSAIRTIRPSTTGSIR